MATRVQTETLTADTVETFTLTEAAGGGQLLEVTHHGDASAVVYVRTDGTDPVIAADECDVVLTGQRVTIGAGYLGTLKAISAGTPTLTVSALA